MTVQKKKRQQFVQNMTSAVEIPPTSDSTSKTELNQETLQDKYNTLVKENLELKLQLNKKCRDEQNFTEKIHSYEAKICEMEKIIKNSDLSSRHFEDRIAEIFKEQFSKNQLDIILKKKKEVRWTSDELGQALVLLYFSRRAYVHVKNQLKYPLPGISTLQRWVSKKKRCRTCNNQWLFLENI